MTNIVLVFRSDKMKTIFWNVNVSLKTYMSYSISLYCDVDGFLPITWVSSNFFWIPAVCVFKSVFFLCNSFWMYVSIFFTQIQIRTVQGKMFNCINAKPFVYSDLMMTLNDLVHSMFPACTVSRCAYVLANHLNTDVYWADS